MIHDLLSNYKIKPILAQSVKFIRNRVIGSNLAKNQKLKSKKSKSH